MIRALLFSLFFVISFAEGAKITVIIPCWQGHAPHLEPLLYELAGQSLVPDEVVVSFSESGAVDPVLIETLKNRRWPFDLVILTETDQLYAGPNRNRAFAFATGELIICQDADDLPHPQRIEIIHTVYEDYAPDHIMHNYSLDESKELRWEVFDMNEIPVKRPNSWYSLLRDFRKVTHGNIAVSRHVLSQIQWPNKRVGEDFAFNKRCFERFGNTVVIDWPLYLYRVQNSSGHNKN